MRALFHLVVIPCILILNACEKVIDNPDLPYVNQLVICGFVNADSTVQRVAVSHTLPLTQDYIYDSAIVRDAEVILHGPGFDSVMHYEEATQWYVTAVPVQEGKQYRLSVRWSGLSAEAATIVPETPKITSHGCILVQDYSNDSSFSFISVVDSIRATWQGSALIGFVHTRFFSELVDTLTADNYRQSGTLTPFDYILEQSAPSSPTIIKSEADYLNLNAGVTYHASKLKCIDRSYLNIMSATNRNHDVFFGSFGVTPNANISGQGFGYFIGLSRSTNWLITKVK